MTKKANEEQRRDKLQPKTKRSDPALLPGEDWYEYDDLKESVLEELSPEGTLQEFAAREIVELRWELQRLRHMRLSVVARWAAGMASDVIEEVGPDSGLTSEAERTRLGMKMMHSHPVIRRKAMEEFEERTGIPAESLLAEAFCQAPGVALLDRRIDATDRRYRAAVKYFRSLREQPLHSAA